MFFCHLQVAFDEGTDEFSAYFNGLTNPKVLITTSDRPRGVSGYCLATHVYYLTESVSLIMLEISKRALEEISFDLFK